MPAAHGIGKLVYTSTPSVTHRATHPVEGGTAETVPYGEHFQAHVCHHQDHRREGGAGGQRCEPGNHRVAPAPDLGAGRQPDPAAPGGTRERRPPAHRRRAATTKSTPPSSTTPRRRISMPSTTSHRGRPAPARPTSSATANRGRCATCSTGCCARPARRSEQAPAVPRGVCGRRACEGLWTLALPLKGEPPMTRFLAEQLSTSALVFDGACHARFRLRAEGDDGGRAGAVAGRVRLSVAGRWGCACQGANTAW
jgi:hypothetical protein